MRIASIYFKVIPAGGFFVLGQEQDELAANFSANEAFIGQMSQLNIWSYELPASDIADMARHAENFIGNVIAWSDFYDPADAGIKKIQPSVARTGKLSFLSCHVKKTGPDYFLPFLQISVILLSPFLPPSVYIVLAINELLSFSTVHLQFSNIAFI